MAYNNIVSTSVRRRNNASMLIGRCLDVVFTEYLLFDDVPFIERYMHKPG